MTGAREAAQRELARRELARRELRYFAEFFYTGWPGTAPHLELLCDRLQAVARYVESGGEEGIGRLMVEMPPRHWKSSTASVIFPAWFLGRNPDRRVIVTSYNAALAVSFSRRARNLVQDDGFRAVFGDRSGLEEPISLAMDSQSAEEWGLRGCMGGLVAAGVGGGITGKGAHLLIIDDPHKDRLEAESLVKREAVWGWYQSTAYTRLERGGAVVLILTRWHPDDLAGRLLVRMADESGADQWETLVLPAVAEPWAAEVSYEERMAALRAGWVRQPDALGREPGAALWNAVYNESDLGRIRDNIGRYEWDALYQQRPQRLEGALIRAYEIKQVTADQLPSGLRQARYWDLAVSGNRRADFIAGARVGRSRDGQLAIMDIVRLPGPWATARARMVEAMRRDPAEVVQGVEVSGQQGGYYQELKRELGERAVVPVDPRQVGNKEVRAQLWATRIQDGLVYLVRGPWDVEGFLSEAIAFPRGAHDDRVDAVSGAVWMLARGAGMRKAESRQG